MGQTHTNVKRFQGEYEYEVMSGESHTFIFPPYNLLWCLWLLAWWAWVRDCGQSRPDQHVTNARKILVASPPFC